MPGDGEPCLEGNCADGNRCNWQAEVCTHEGTPGEACDPISDWEDTCLHELHCAEGICREDFGPDHVCTQSRECLSGNCETQAGMDGRCVDGGGREPMNYCDPSGFQGGN